MRKAMPSRSSACSRFTITPRPHTKKRDVYKRQSHDLLSANDYYQTPGWLLRDLDGDEIPELLLGADWGDGHSVIFNIYRLDGAKAVRVVDGWNRDVYKRQR